jgi:hypothetical protein
MIDTHFILISIYLVNLLKVPILYFREPHLQICNKLLNVRNWLSYIF